MFSFPPKAWRWLVGFLGLFSFALPGWAEESLAKWEFDMDGVRREGLVHAPATAKSKPTPLVFVFHGHGGSAGNVVRTFDLPGQWPEAISIHLQGLNTPNRLVDPEGNKSGWQQRVGEQGDRDLKLFDAALARAKRDFKVDEKRIYSTGHSNGGGFTYLLWAERGDLFAAMGPSSSLRLEGFTKLKPKPLMHIAGEMDPVVVFARQRQMIDAVKKLNGCVAEGTSLGQYVTLFASPNGTPVETYIHPGGHEFARESVPYLVRFFKEHPAAEK